MQLIILNSDLSLSHISVKSESICFENNNLLVIGKRKFEGKRNWRIGIVNKNRQEVWGELRMNIENQ